MSNQKKIQEIDVKIKMLQSKYDLNIDEIIDIVRVKFIYEESHQFIDLTNKAENLLVNILSDFENMKLRDKFYQNARNKIVPQLKQCLIMIEDGQDIPF